MQVSLIEVKVGYRGQVSAEFSLSTRYEPRHEKTNVLVSDLVRHKPGCTATEDL